MFEPNDLRSALERLAPADRLLVAYSGGVDSHVLLFALCAYRARLGARELVAVHVDHGLSPYSVEWSRHCQLTCAALNVRCSVARVDARPRPDESPEAAARRARYTAFESIIQPGDVLLTAHHQDDQAETLLLQLLRGAGPRGLAGMPFVAPFARGRLARPLLDVSRHELLEYAQSQRLNWINDPSNTDVRLNRNYLRATIVPLLKQRWPAATVTLARSARLCAEATEVLEDVGRLDLNAPPTDRAETYAGAGRATANVNATLAIAKLKSLSVTRQRNLLKQWLHELDLPTPQETHIAHITAMIDASEDANPLVQWRGAEVRRYRDYLHASAPLPRFDPNREYPWTVPNALTLPGAGELSVRPVTGDGVRASALQDAVVVRFRRGGEHFRPRGRRETHTLKHLFQDAGVPPWQRERIPLVYVGPELVCVVGYWIADAWCARAGEDGLLIELRAGC